MLGRLSVPLGALTAFAVLVALGAMLPPGARGVESALFLVSAPLVPAGLVLGARPMLRPMDVVPLSVPATAVLPEPVLDRLSPREREVLEAMADGASNAAIARRLLMSTSAVEKHTTAIFAKLDLPTDTVTHRRVSAVVAYLRAVR